MDAKEKKILKQICKNLDNSTYTSWSTGDFTDWVAYAKLMKSAISNSTTILETLSDDDPENDILSTEDFLAKNLKE